MNTPACVRDALSSLAAVALLGGCGASQGVRDALTSTPQSIVGRSVSDVAQLGRDSTGKRGDLLYVGTTSGILILSYPAGKQVGELKSYAEFPFVCSDPNNGDVFVTGDDIIHEYAHGGTSPIGTLTPPSSYSALMGCSVGPGTGNLAVAVYATSSSGNGAVLIYHHGQGSPTAYEDPTMDYYYSCAYDGEGNLFVSGLDKNDAFLLTELPKGSSTFTDIALNTSIGGVAKILWDGTYLTVRYGSIYRIQISGSSGTVVGTTKAKDISGITYWIQGGTFVAPYGKLLRHYEQRLGFWNYPAGGKAAKILKGLIRGKHNHLSDLTVSAAQ